MSIQHQPHKWNILSEELYSDCKIFEVYKNHCQHPVNHRTGDFYSIHSKDFALALALTEENELVVVEQYRFGCDEIHLEVPGGIIEPNEDPKVGAMRELLEETGYSGTSAHVIGKSRPNPAILNNHAYFVCIEGCKKTAEVNWDLHEEIRISTMPLDEVFYAVKTGKISHGIAVNALFYLRLYLEDKAVLEA